ncbi:hypothetical protein ACWGPD_09420 [Streptomyces hirsutus]|uniref:hypothetical protein n=1 Tax=Streptomyces hirsutus TaxID=35620 RepID=UPI00364576E5
MLPAAEPHHSHLRRRLFERHTLASLRLEAVQTVATAVRTAWNAAPPVDRLRLPLPELLALARDAAHRE